MIEVNGKDWEKLDDKEKIAYCDTLLEDVKKSRANRDLEWYLNHMFVEGQHYLTYNATKNTLEASPPRERGEVRMVVNKLRSSKRAIQNYVTSSRPKWEVVPGDTDEDTIKNARRSGKLLDYVYIRLHLEQMVAGVVDSALEKSVGWVELDWDAEAEKGQGQVRVRLHDPFDIWIDRAASVYMGRIVSPFMAKTIKKTVQDVKADKRYDKKRKDVKSDDELAVSQMKAKIIRKETGHEESAIERVTVKEFMLWDPEKNSKGGHVHLFTYAGDIILRDEALDLREYPIYPFQISMNPLSVYQRAWVSDVIPLNKALDRAVSQKIMYVNQALRYAIIADKGHGANVVSNEMGEVIEINKGRMFQQMTVNPLPSGFDALTSELSLYMEDILGAHDAALGRLPSGARSGKTLEALQAADSNNLAGITQSLESFLSVLGERILEIVADKYVASRIIKIAEPEDGQEYLKVRGGGSPVEGGEEDVTIVTEDNEVIVKVGSWLGYTKETQLETLKELAGLGILPAEEVLRQLEFPNVEELSAKAREQRLEQGQMDLAIAGHAGEQGGGGGAQKGGIDMIKLADKESMEMLQGRPLPPTEGATPEHTQAHADFMSSDTFAQEADEQIDQIFMQHVSGEAQQNGFSM